MIDCDTTADTDCLAVAMVKVKLLHLAVFLGRYVIRHGGTHGMIKAAATEFRCSRSRIRHRMKMLKADNFARIEHEPST